MSPVEQSILSTLCWFDLWHQPLTTHECWYWLWNENKSDADLTWEKIFEVLTGLEKSGLVKNDRGFWQLKDSPNYATERLSKNRWSIAKRKKAQRAANIIIKLPFVRLVALANTMAFAAAKRDSDIDLLIIVKSGRIFFTRLLVTALVQLIGWRRHGQQVANRICLSFYLTDNNLDINFLAYKDDPYLHYWLASLQPLADRLTFSNLLRANSWVWDKIPYRLALAGFSGNPDLAKWADNRLEKLLAGRLGNMLEYWSRWVQLRLIKSHSKSRLNDGSTAVMVSDSILKFHESDQRSELALQFRTKQQQVLSRNS